MCMLQRRNAGKLGSDDPSISGMSCHLYYPFKKQLPNAGRHTKTEKGH